MYSLGLLIILRYGEGNEKKHYKKKGFREIMKKKYVLKIYDEEVTGV